MNTKLTLRLDDELIREAKEYSQETGKSVSRLVEDYFRENLHFELGARERTAIAEFLSRAQAAGVLQLFPAPPGVA